MPRFYVVLKNSSDCELDRQRVEPVDEDALTVCVMQTVKDWTLAAGDTIHIEEIV